MESKVKRRSYGPGSTIRREVIVHQRGGWRPLTSGQGGQGRSHEPTVLRFVNSTFGGAAGATARSAARGKGRLLTPEQLWMVYVRVGDVRAAVDSIARRVSTWDWMVSPTIDPAGDEDRFRQALEQCRKIRRFLSAPNQEGETWQSLVYRWVVDALVFGHGSLENGFGPALAQVDDPEGPTLVMETDGFLRELFAVYSPSLVPQYDDDDRLEGYVQDFGSATGKGATDGKKKLIPPSKIVRLNIAPNTKDPNPVPIIETIVVEATTLFRMAERAAKTADASEIPPGFLILTGTSAQTEKDIRAGAEQGAGKDHKLKVIRTPGATTPAHWLRVQQDLKEVMFTEVLREQRKVIWRNFGVSQTEMGDTVDVNRSTAAVDLEVGQSALIEPLLEMIQALVNNRVLPLIVAAAEKDPDAEVLCQFMFDHSVKYTPEQELALAKADDIRLKNGSRAINENRVRDGLPRIEGGDAYRLAQANQEIIGDELLLVAGEDDSDAIDGDDGDDDAAPGEAEAGRPVGDVLLRLRTLATASARQRLDASLLPSEWQPRGVFADVRTVNLTDLWEVVIGYQRKVEPIWAEARREVVATTASFARAGTTGGIEYQRRVVEAMSTLRQKWSAATLDAYLRAGAVGLAGAKDIAGDEAVVDAEEFARTYHDRAMAFLDQLVSDVQTRVLNNVAAVQRAKVSAEAGLGPDSTDGDLLEAVELSFNANEHRISNWSGRLVELTNLVLVVAVTATSPPAEPLPEGEVTPEQAEAAAAGNEWWCVWETVGDAETCDTCDREGSLPARPLSSLNTVPGGDTECRANCRCVLVVWTKQEVDAGVAEKLVSPGPVR